MWYAGTWHTASRHQHLKVARYNRVSLFFGKINCYKRFSRSWHTGGSCWVGGHLLKVMNHPFVTIGVRKFQIRLWFSASMTDCVFKFSLDLKSHWLHEFLGLVISISKVARYNRVASLMQDHLLPWHAGYPVYEPCKTRAILDMSRDLWLWLYILMVPMDSEKLSGALWRFRVSFRPEIMTTRSGVRLI